MSRKTNTIFLAILTCLMWSTVYASIKTGLKYDTPLFFASKRFIIASVMLLPFAGRIRDYISIITVNPKLLFHVTLLQVIMNYTFFYLGMNLVPGALGAVIVGSQPLITALVAGAITDNELITRRKIFTIISGIAGIILISTARQALRLGSVTELLGVILILGANFSTSLSNVLVSVNNKNINPVILNSISLFAGGIIIFILASIFEKQVTYNFPAPYLISLIWISFVAAFAFSTWYRLLQRPEVKVSELNLWKFIIPVFGAIISWIVVPEEKPDPMTIAGIIIISLSLLFFFIGIKGRTHDKSINK
ncbi:MAG: DMT family transporter [Bacteroidales bacterium]